MRDITWNTSVFPAPISSLENPLDVLHHQREGSGLVLETSPISRIHNLKRLGWGQGYVGGGWSSHSFEHYYTAECTVQLFKEHWWDNGACNHAGSYLQWKHREIDACSVSCGSRSIPGLASRIWFLSWRAALQASPGGWRSRDLTCR